MRIQFSPDQLGSDFLPDEGTFVVRFTEVKYRTSSTGTDWGDVTFVGIGTYAGKKGKESLPLTSKTTFRWEPIFRATGSTNEELLRGVDTDSIIGKFAKVHRSVAGTRPKGPGKEGVYTDYKHTFEPLTEQEMKEVLANPEDHISL